MNGDQAMARSLASSAAALQYAGVDVAVCPPFPYLQAVADALGDSGVSLGAQDVAEQEAGAFTGAVAASMLVDVGCSLVILGHSERRSVFGETNEQVAVTKTAAPRSRSSSGSARSSIT